VCVLCCVGVGKDNIPLPQSYYSRVPICAKALSAFDASILTIFIAPQFLRGTMSEIRKVGATSKFR